jgi:hypothetical protein
MQKLDFISTELKKPPTPKISKMTRELLAQHQNEQILAKL